MIGAILSAFKAAGALQRIATLATIAATIGGGALWAYSSIKNIGAAEARAERLQSDYDRLSQQTGEAIAELNAIHARENMAAADRRRQMESQQAQTIAELETMKGELDEARKNSKCFDQSLPADMANRVRQLTSDVIPSD